MDLATVTVLGIVFLLLTVVTLLAIRKMIADSVGSLSWRVERIEQDVRESRDAATRLHSEVAQANAIVQSLQTSAEAVRQEVQETARGLASLRQLAEDQARTDARNAEALRRLEALIAGSGAKGLAGENLVEAIFRQLPPEWQARNVRIEGGVVEFALRLPNDQIVPIDSKWPATRALDELIAETDPNQRERLAEEVRRAVRQKVQEVKKYIHPERTWGFAIAVVPDAVFEVAAREQVDGLAQNVVLLSYSGLVPYLLLIVQTVLRSGVQIDVAKLSAAIDQVRQALSNVEEELDGRLSKALTMIQNSRDETRQHVRKANTALSSVTTRVVGNDEERPELPE
jgi:DNA recombination protein RmuC